MRRRRTRRGFTLIELLVVIAMIGVLVALLLPAVQAARAAARRIECSHNLTQISIAAQAYETTFDAYPPGVVDPVEPVASQAVGYHHSWIVQMLPYLDEHNAAAQVDFSVGVYHPANAPVRGMGIGLLACPSSGHGPTVGIADSCYAGVHHDVDAAIDTENHGIFIQNRQIRLDEVTDGTAYTLLVGEKIVEPNDLGWMSGTRATLRNTGFGLNESGFRRDGRPMYAGQGTAAAGGGPIVTNSIVGGFSSSHTGLVMFAFADGSVRAMPDTMSLDVLQRLAHRADGALDQGID